MGVPLNVRDPSTITIKAALAWVTLPRQAQPVQWKPRLCVVRGFARYLATIDPAVQVPPAGLLACRRHRPVPHVFTDAEIAALLAVAGRNRWRLPAATVADALPGKTARTQAAAASAAGQPESSPLTRREQQVAALIAEGLTNKQIAARLVISQRTAEAHVEHILTKLGFTCRAQIAAMITHTPETV